MTDYGIILKLLRLMIVNLSVLKLILSITQKVCQKNNCWHLFDDLESVGMMAALEAMAKFNASRGVKLTTYLYDFVLGAMLDYLKKERKQSHESLDEMRDCEDQKISWEPSDPARLIDEELEINKKAEMLAQAIEDLPERNRRMFIEKYFNNLTYLEIAELLATNEADVRNTLYDTRLALRVRLSLFQVPTLRKNLPLHNLQGNEIREVARLYYHDRLTVGEIANRLGFGIEEIKKILLRADLGIYRIITNNKRLEMAPNLVGGEENG